MHMHIVHVEDEVEDHEDAIDITEEAFLLMIKLYNHRTGQFLINAY